MPLQINPDSSAVAALAQAIAQLSPLDASGIIHQLEARSGQLAIDWRRAVAACAALTPATFQVGASQTPVNAEVLAAIDVGGTQAGLPVVLRSIQSTQPPVAGTLMEQLVVSDFGGVSNPAIYDTTSAVNTAIDTGVLDVSQWRQLFLLLNASGGAPAFIVAAVDDAGSIAFLQMVAAIAAVNSLVAWGVGVAVGNVATAVALPFPLPRRVRITSAAVAGQTTRIRIEGRR